LPTYVMEHLQTCVGEMQDISAQQDATEGKAPASVRSGAAIRLLQQADMAVLAMPKKLLFRSDRKVAEMMVATAAHQYKAGRVIYTLGRDRMIQAKDFLGADLRGKTSFRVVAESGLLDSKAARQQQVLDYVQLGILNPQIPEHQRAILKMLEIGDVRDYVAEQTVDEKNADSENRIMATMAQAKDLVAPQVWDFDDHEIHIRRHNFFRKAPEYRMMSSRARKIVDQHVEIHQTYLMQAMQQQMAMNQSQKGMPGEKGNPSAPKNGPSGEAPQEKPGASGS